MNNSYKLNKYEAISLILIVMLNKLILNIPYFIADSVGTGAIINLIYIGIIGFIFVIILNKLFSNFPNYDIIDILEYLGGKPLKIIFGIIIILSFLFVSFVTINNFSTMLKTIYFNNSPIIFILLFFIIGPLIANLTGFRPIVRIICLLIPFILITIVLSFLEIVDNISFDKFMPIFGYNYKSTFLSGALNIFVFYMIAYYYFLMPLLKNTSDFKKVTRLSYIISWLMLFITVLSILSIFPVSINMEPLNSLYLLSRQIEISDFVQRIDAIFILLWILSILSYLSLTVFMINRTIKKIFNISSDKDLSYSTCSIIFGISLIPLDLAISRFIENSLYKYLMISLIFGIFFIILIIANIKHYFKSKQNKYKNF